MARNGQVMQALMNRVGSAARTFPITDTKLLIEVCRGLRYHVTVWDGAGTLGIRERILI